MSNPSQPPLDRTRSRLPAPTLFVGPPSRNASSTSVIHHATTKPQQTPNQPPRIPISRTNTLKFPLRETHQEEQPQRTLEVPPSSSPIVTAAKTEDEPGRKEALWAEMQHTLAEVDLSAENGSHVFGVQHAEALEGLRTAQVALAQAWARSEVEMGEEKGNTSKDGDVTKREKAMEKHDKDKQKEKDKEGNTSSSKKTRERSGTDASSRSALEEETESDVGLARRRREANDRYFRSVDLAVKDVVRRLEEVGKAMKGVERETRDIWGDRDSLELGSESSV